MSRSHALFDQWYECGDKKFFNIWQAFDYQKQTGHFTHYRFDREFLDSIKNIKRPKNLCHQYIKNLIITRLKQLRKQNKYLRLALGGGTDSFTILKYCVQHDIYIDEVFTQMTSIDSTAIKPNIEYLPAFNFARRHVGTCIGRIKRLHPTIKDLENVLVSDWYKDPRFVKGNHLPGRWCIPNVYLKHTNLPINETITITGIDKPFIKRHDNKFYYCQIDSTISELMGCDNVLPLFLDKHNPELAVAMAYGLLDHGDTTKDFISYSSQPADKKLAVLHNMGLESTGHHFIDFHLLGKNTVDVLNRKNQAAHKELRDLGRQDICDGFLSCMDKIIKDYQHLPHTITIKDSKYIETVRRLTDEIPIYQDSFGS